MEKSAPFFMTHHSPVGAWSSFTFGLPGKGVSIDHESASLENTADFLVALSHGPGKVKAFPFVTGSFELDPELRQVQWGTGNPKKTPNSIKQRWMFLKPSQIQRILTPCVDQYTSEEMTLRVYTPHPALPDPDLGLSLKFASCPGILMELTIDNSGTDQPAYGFIGMSYNLRGRIRPLDWSTEGRLSGIAFSGTWAMAARTIPGKVFTIRDNGISDLVEKGTPVVHNGGQEGGILMVIPGGVKETLQVAFGFYHQGTATQGIQGSYYYGQYFRDVEEVCAYILDHAGEIHKQCREFEESLGADSLDREKVQLFSQAIRAYYANSQLTNAGGKPCYNICEGQYLWRNTLDLAVDHLPYELWRNPWVVRNIIDLYIDRYSYHDQIRFSDAPDAVFPGGLAFTHDMGSYTTFTPKGMGGYEKKDSEHYQFMTTEELLNGIYCLTSYALTTNDRQWIKKRQKTALELLESMENRDHYLPEKRNGILKGESLQCGLWGREITTYDALDPALLDTLGNLYLTVKTLGAALLLHEYFIKTGEPTTAQRAQTMGDKTGKALEEFFDHNGDYLRANLYSEVESKTIAAIEPLAVLIFLGLKERLFSYKDLMALFRKHIAACLKPGAGIDSNTGGLRLSSTSNNTWVSKVILCEFVIRELIQIDLKSQYPGVFQELLGWAQVSAAETTISDQIHSDTRTVVGASYYPRPITASLWVKSRIHGKD